MRQSVPVIAIRRAHWRAVPGPLPDSALPARRTQPSLRALGATVQLASMGRTVAEDLMPWLTLRACAVSLASRALGETSCATSSSHLHAIYCTFIQCSLGEVEPQEHLDTPASCALIVCRILSTGSPCSPSHGCREQNQMCPLMIFFTIALATLGPRLAASSGLCPQ